MSIGNTQKKVYFLLRSNEMGKGNVRKFQIFIDLFEIEKHFYLIVLDLRPFSSVFGSSVL